MKLFAVLLTACLASLPPLSAVPDPHDRLLATRRLAYDATFENDAAGLRAAAAAFDELADAGGTPGGLVALARYYAGWSRWSLAASEVVAGDMDGARATLEASVDDLRAARARRSDLADTPAALAASLIALVQVAPERFPAIAPEVTALRREALALGPANPRVVLMDAGLIFFNPPERGGSRARGLARFDEALRLFEQERRADDTLPDWGRVMALGWVAQVHLAMEPPQTLEACGLARRALAARPDFWFVRSQVLPALGDACPASPRP